MEVEEKSVVVCAIESTSGNVLEEMSLKGVDPCKIPQQVEYVRTKWEELRERIRHLRAEIEPAAESFQTFLSEMSKFLTWLSTYYAKVYDEFCMKVPQDASQELIGQMMNQLEVFRAELIKKRPDQELVWAESDKWVEFKVPEEVLSELPSPPEISPDPPTDDDEEKSESVSDTPPLPFVKTCMEKGWEKWWRVRQMLEDREAELERCSGSYQLFAQQVQKLLEWLQEQLNMNALADPPPADLGVVEGYHKQVKVRNNVKCFGIFYVGFTDCLLLSEPSLAYKLFHAGLAFLQFYHFWNYFRLAKTKFLNVLTANSVTKTKFRFVYPVFW